MTSTLETASQIGIVTTEAASHTLYIFDHGGIQPGGFKTDLYSLIAHADPQNRDRLARAFPTEVAAYRLAHDHEDGIEILRLIANGDAR